MKKYVLIFIVLISFSAFSQSSEKFMKLQRVFSVDSSFLVNRPTISGALVLVYQQRIPTNKLWIVKNINFSTNGNSNFQNNNYSTIDYDLSIAINNTPILVLESGTPNLRLYGSSSISKQEPLLISSDKDLQFYSKWKYSSGGPEKYKVHIFYSVEEYIVE